jgi:cytochrome c oxidase subunit 4
MAESEAHDIEAHVRSYLIVFAALGALTIVTVAISYIELPTAYAISAAVFVASIKASLVAAYFMHLISEKKVIHWLLLLCASFLVVLFTIPVAMDLGIGPLWPIWAQ